MDVYSMLIFAILQKVASGVIPTFYASNNMRVLLLPKDTKIGSVVYRLKGSDPDADVLTFGVLDPVGKQLIEMKSVSATDANVILISAPTERSYNISIFVSDGRDTTVLPCNITITDVIGLPSPFVDYESLITVVEGTNNGVISQVSVKEKETSQLPVIFELQEEEKPPENFFLRPVFGPRGVSKAELEVVRPLDYEGQNVFRLTVIAQNAWTNESVDTRNVFTLDIVVMVTDVQDTPPKFKELPPVIAVPESVKPGDGIFTVLAEDGDHGKSRNVTYSIVPGSPAASLFTINQLSGVVALSRSMQELRQQYASTCPLLLGVKASEVVSGRATSELTSSTADVALVLLNTENHNPRFLSPRYVGSIEENSPPLTAVRWEGTTAPKVVDDDRGKNGTFQLYLTGDGGTFDVQPSSAINEVTFSLLVKNPAGLDYENTEKEYFDFSIVARETESVVPLSSTAAIRVKIIDINDHIPLFKEEKYEVALPEDASPGTTVIKIEATDQDSGDYGVIRYTSINGPIANNLNLDPETGIVTLIHTNGLDRERIPEYVLTVEARDDRGRGNKNVVELVLKLEDANDNAPVFLQPRYNAVLNPDMKSFTERLVIEADDADSSGPNSDIRYEIVKGNYQEKFSIDEKTGEVRLKEKLTPGNGEQEADRVMPVITLKVRAHDQGVPVRSSTVDVQVHNQEYLNRTITFILPEAEDVYKERRVELERGLSALTGAHVNIHSIRPHNTSKDRTIVRTWVAYPLKSTIDLTDLQFMVSNIFGRQYILSDTPQVETVRKAQFDTVFWLLIVLVIILILALIALCCYCCLFRRYRKDGSRLGSASKVAPSDNILNYQENGTVDTQDGNRSGLGMRFGWRGYPRFWRRPMSAIERGEKVKRSDINLLDARRNARMLSPESRRREEEYYRNLEERLVREGRMGRLYQQGRPLSPGADMLFDQAPPDNLSGRQVGRYVIFRKDVNQRNREGEDRLLRVDNYPLDTSERMDLDPDQARRLEGAKRTEILYIRSPPRNEEESDRYYSEFSDTERTRGQLHRSVSETAIHNPSRIPRMQRFNDLKEQDRLKFSRYHRRDSDVYLEGEEIPPRDGKPEPYQPLPMSWNRNSEEYPFRHAEYRQRNAADTTVEETDATSAQTQRRRHRTQGDADKTEKPRTATIRKAETRDDLTVDADAAKQTLQRTTEVDQSETNKRASSTHISAAQGVSAWAQDEDSDSGIGRDPGGLKLKKANLLEKKSLFTIAYDGMHTQRIKSDDGDIPSP